MAKDINEPYTPWHPIFQYILEQILPEDVFDIETEVIVGKLPLKIDFIVIKKKKDVRANLPSFLDFINDYEYTIIEYKHPRYYYKFHDMIKLSSYSFLFLIKKEITDLDKIIRVAVFNNLESNFHDLLAKNKFKIREVKKGLNLTYQRLENTYLINLEIIDKKDKALLFAFFSQKEEEYNRAVTELINSPFYKAFVLFIHYLTGMEDFMRLIEKDKEWAKRVNKTLEDFLKELAPEIRLKGLSPEEVLKQYSPEDRLKNLSPEDRLKDLSPEDRLKDLSPEVIEKYLKNLKEKG